MAGIFKRIWVTISSPSILYAQKILRKKPEVIEAKEPFPEYWEIEALIRGKNLKVISNGTKEGTTYICEVPGYVNFIEYNIGTGKYVEFSYHGPPVKCDYTPLGMYAAIYEAYGEFVVRHFSAEVEAAFAEYNAPVVRLMKKYPGIVF